eukprot:165853_1
MIELFGKMDSIIICTTSETGEKEYVFDLTKLLTNIIDSSLISIEIKATHHYDIGYKYIDVSWLSGEWQRSKLTLEPFLNSINWNIHLSHTHKKYGYNVYLEDTLTIFTFNDENYYGESSCDDDVIVGLYHYITPKYPQQQLDTHSDEEKAEEIN